MLGLEPKAKADKPVHPDFMMRVYLIRLESQIEKFEDKYGKLSLKQKNHLKRKLVEKVRNRRKLE